MDKRKSKSRMNYAEQWRVYKYYLIIFILIFASIFPAQMLVVPLLTKVVTEKTAVWVVMTFWGIAFIASYANLICWRCPRCNKNYFIQWNWLKFDPFVRKCLHCKLPKWTSTDKT